MKIKILLFLAGFILAQQIHSQQFALGADVSWLTEMEKYNRKFFTSDGQQKECMSLLKENVGMNAIRLRVWVNPTAGWNGLQDVLVKAKRAKSLGMKLMIDFHYSDTWADPGKQTKPAAWASLDFNQLKQAVYNHTFQVMDSLKFYGIFPEWVQVGNETGNGMLWETGKASVSMSNYTQLNNAGYDAVKAVSPNSKVIVHLHNGYDNGLFRWIFDGLKNNGGKYDVIGMSLYPNWYTTPNDWVNANKACLNNMNDMVSRYGKEVMIVECGMSWDKAADCKNFLTDLINKTKSVTGGKGTGVFYWEPQCYNWNNYTLGAFEQVNINGVTGYRPTIALDAFKIASDLKDVTNNEFVFQWDSISGKLSFTIFVEELKLYDMQGKLIVQKQNIQEYQTTDLRGGVYLLEIKNSVNGTQICKIII
jgi:arabinogalactan endo-1,4-beta-galactosidase